MKTNKAKDIQYGEKHKKEIKLGEPEFSRLTEEDNKSIDKLLNDKRQNRAQAIKSYLQAVLVARQMSLFQERFEKAISDGVKIKDNFGLVMSREELELEAQKNYIDLRFARANVIKMIEDISSTWDMSEEDIQKQAEEWFVNGKNIYG